MIAVAVLSAAVLAIAALLVRRVRLSAQLKATARVGGPWRAAAGGKLGPVAFTAGVSGEGGAWAAHVLGRTVAHGRTVSAVPSGRAPGAGRLLDAAQIALDRVRFDRLDARVHGAADDPATSARVLGVLSAACAALPWARVTGNVDWMADVPFVDLDCHVEATFVPLLVGWDVVCLALRSKEPVTP